MAPSAVSPVRESVYTGQNGAPICHIVTPVGMLGYGFNEEWTEAVLAECADVAPTALIMDSGSTDSGPSKLALGSTTCPRSAYERDIRGLIRLSRKYHAPILTSSAGGDGSNEHVDLFLEIVKEVLEEEDNRSSQMKVITIYSEIDKALIRKRLDSGRIIGCGPSVQPLTAETLDQTPRIVAQMGAEPFLDAMVHHPDFHIMIGGRAYDPAPYVAFAAYHVLEPKHRDLSRMSDTELGALFHMGKILECGGVCATPKSHGAMATINPDMSIDIKPLDPQSRCIPLSVAAHTLYEKSRPDLLVGPGGVLDLTSSRYTQLSDGRTTRISGSTFRPVAKQDEHYTVKLEGARVTGYRTLTMGSFSDPILISQIQTFLDSCKGFALKRCNATSETVDIGFHTYGQTGATPEKIFVVAESLAPSQQLATSLASALRIAFTHGAYPGQKATSGNFGMGIGGRLELEVGECTEFSAYHLITLDEGEEHASPISDTQTPGLFQWKTEIVGHGTIEDYSLGPIPDLASRPVKQSQLVSTAADAKPTAINGTHHTATSTETLFDIATVIRSKNAGPFEVTVDVMFDNRDVYEAVKKADILNSRTIAKLYDLPEDEIIWAGFFDVAMAFKATMPRKRGGVSSCSGGFLEDDVHGSQQYGPLRSLKLSEGLRDAVRGILGGE